MSLADTYRGVRVVDLSENIAGPLACMILGDLGADVIKIEPPGRGEATRQLPPRWAPGDPGDPGGLGESTVFLTLNRNKRSAALDIRTPAGRAAVLRIAGGADVVVESFRPGVADRLGLGFADLSGVSPRVIQRAQAVVMTAPGEKGKQHEIECQRDGEQRDNEREDQPARLTSRGCLA